MTETRTQCADFFGEQSQAKLCEVLVVLVAGLLDLCGDRDKFLVRGVSVNLVLRLLGAGIARDVEVVVVFGDL